MKKTKKCCEKSKKTKNYTIAATLVLFILLSAGAGTTYAHERGEQSRGDKPLFEHRQVALDVLKNGDPSERYEMKHSMRQEKGPANPECMLHTLIEGASYDEFLATIEENDCMPKLAEMIDEERFEEMVVALENGELKDMMPRHHKKGPFPRGLVAEHGEELKTVIESGNYQTFVDFVSGLENSNKTLERIDEEKFNKIVEFHNSHLEKVEK